MATTQSPDNTRPRIASVKSFPRFESSSPPSITTDTSRARSSSNPNSSPVTPQSTLSSAVEPGADDGDVFAQEELVMSPTTSKSHESFEELPIEIRSLTERFLKDLTAPVHPQPVTADSLSELFQDFYTKAESQIAASIAVLSLKIGKKETSPAPSRKGTSTPTRKASGDPAQQMLTASEVTDRKKARRLLELKRTAWEEIVERTVTEKVYSKIYRHKSADDEERDQKLRSRIAALSLVGIGLKELLSGANEIPDDMKEKSISEEAQIRSLLAGARQNLQDMDQEHHPQGKLHHLTLAHKSIVETLSQLFPSSSSADEILPTLIYAIMTSDPASINVFSNLKFIQRFRSASKVDGEAAYCLVNLEAATAFLENVDLASLRAGETPQGESKRPITPSRAKSAPMPMNLGVEPASDPATSGSSSPKPPPSPGTKQSRRLSNLISNGTNRFTEASDQLRGAMLDSADTAFDTIHNTLNGSFNMLFGRLREQQVKRGDEVVSENVLPKTLEDARKLVGTPPPTEDGEGDAASLLTTGSSVPEGEDPLTAKPTANERVTELFGGRRQVRDHSVDSQRSGSSIGKRVAFDGASASSSSTGVPPSAATGNAAIDGIRNFGNTINPLNQISRMGGLFGRSGSVTSPAPTPAVATPPLTTVNEKPLLSPGLSSASRSRSSSDAGSKAEKAVQELKKIKPPAKKFIECQDVRDLKLGEVEELLREYQRLVRDVGKVVSSV